MEKKSKIVLIQLKITRHEIPFSLNPLLPILGFSIRLDVNPGEKKKNPNKDVKFKSKTNTTS